jgi:ppGpp synthetase/RelA/SpoT-type nucleotidyltranferase
MELVKDDFLEQYNISLDTLEAAKINWTNIEEIFDHHLSQIDILKTHANSVAELLRNHPKVHTVRTRIKNPFSLIEKIIRKTAERQKSKSDKEWQFTINNYEEEITDIIGVRAIHIFKEDTTKIHEFITGNFDSFEQVANIRFGDDSKAFKNLGLTINPRDSGYRSVHYLVKYQPMKKLHRIEIQVRTIFEEGYGEIDHLISYKATASEEISSNLMMLNRLAGSSDEMASVINKLAVSIEERDKKDTEKDQLISRLSDEVDKLNKNIEELQLNTIQKQSISTSLNNIDTTWKEFKSSMDKIKEMKIEFKNNKKDKTLDSDSIYGKQTSLKYYIDPEINIVRAVTNNKLRKSKEDNSDKD